ncbi:MAG TPA: hypothetical protein PLJ38_08025, partial [bacterium]|nr:hypothetical protein [bacterium]
LLIDDAGSGNFVGGMVIAGWSDDIEEYKSIELSPEKYNETFANIQEAVYSAVKKIINYFSNDYELISIFLCQSMLFDFSSDKLIEDGCVVLRGKIEGELQNLIEYDFMNHLKKLGLPKYVDFFMKIIDRDKNLGYRLLNNFCVNYVKVDLENRLKLCKSQSKLYLDLKNSVLHREIVENKFKKKPKLCCNCGHYIYDTSLYKNTLSFEHNVFYTHINCRMPKH